MWINSLLSLQITDYSFPITDYCLLITGPDFRLLSSDICPPFSVFHYPFTNYTLTRGNTYDSQNSVTNKN